MPKNYFLNLWKKARNTYTEMQLCSILNISRGTAYRWKKDDKDVTLGVLKKLEKIAGIK